MISRDEAIKLIEEHVQNKNIIKHMFATEALMGEVYDELKKCGRADQELGGTKEEWMMAGLLHDGDYCEGVPMEKQGVQIAEWVKEKSLPAGRQGFELPDNVCQAMAAHNRENTKVEPRNLMDWTIFIGDSLTGLIVAATLVLPTKKLNDLTVESVLKRFKERSFAKGTRREDILLCKEKIGLSFEEFASVCLKSMQAISKDLGL